MSSNEWTTFEKLLLAQAVFKCGESNWVAVSRSLKQHPNCTNRSQEFFSQKQCATMYSFLLEQLHLGRKRRNDAIHVDQPDIIKLTKRLFLDRLAELKGLLHVYEEKFDSVISDIDELVCGEKDEEYLKGKLESIKVLKDELTSGQDPFFNPERYYTREDSVPNSPTKEPPIEVVFDLAKARLETHTEKKHREKEKSQDKAEKVEKLDKTEKQRHEKNLKLEKDETLPIAEHVRSMRRRGVLGKTLVEEEDEEVKSEASGPTKVVKKGWTTAMLNIVEELEHHQYGKAFTHPVDESEAPMFYKAIKKPMTLSKVKQNLKDQNYSTVEEVERDILLTFQNILMFNSKDDQNQKIYNMALTMKRFAEKLFSNNRLNEEEPARRKRRVK